MKIYSLVFVIKASSTIMLNVTPAESFYAAEMAARQLFKTQGFPGELDLLASNEFVVPESEAKVEPVAPLVMIQKEEVKTLMSEKNQVMQTIVKFKDADLFRIKRHLFDENEQEYLSAKIQTK